MQALADAAMALSLSVPEAFPQELIGVPADVCTTMAIERFGRGFPVEEYFRLAAELQERAVEAGHLSLKPGVLEILTALDELALPRAVATSSGREKARRHLAKAGLLERFDAIVTRDDVSCGKPHPDLFLHAASTLGLDPQHCLALEDSYMGVHAACAANMPVIMIPDQLPATAKMHAMCFHIADSLHDIRPMLARRMQFPAGHFQGR